MNTKINLITGIFLFVLTLVANQWTLARVLTRDGVIEQISYRLIIHAFDIAVIVGGLLLILKRKTFKIKEIIIPCLIAILVPFVCMEVYARIRSHNTIPAHVKFWRQELGDKMSEFVVPKHKEGGLMYYDYHLFAGAPFKTKQVEFTNYFSARNVPDSFPLGKGDIIVWLFGGSTMQNRETIDRLTIANSLAQNLRKNYGIKPTVFNFGVGGFQSSLESIKFQDLFRRISIKERPGIVVFYDGFNDAGYSFRCGAGNMQGDLSRKMEALIKRENSKLFFYSASNILGGYVVFWRDFVKPRIDNLLFGSPDSNYSVENLQKAVEIYEINTRMIRAICREFGVKPVFVLQPMIFTKSSPTPFEQTVIESLGEEPIRFQRDFYRVARERMKQYSDFYDFSGIFDGSTRNDFYDEGHTGPYTGVDTGRHLAEIVAKQTREK